MSRLAVKAYCRQAMALLDVPVPCVVVTQRPREIAVGEQAVITINVPESKERRLTLSRGAGRKEISHQVRLDIYWIAADEQQGGAAFDDLLEQIDGIFRTVTIPVAISDPDSGSQSVLVWIGEDLTTSVAEPLLDESLQGLVVFTAQKTLAVTEHVMG
ncbi:MAG TPA: hypothetical protein VIU62_17155 [Chloroflexota bacterium]